MKRPTALFALILVIVIIGVGCSAPFDMDASVPEFAHETPSAPSPAPREFALSPAPGEADTEHVPEFSFDADESAVAIPILTPSDSRGRRLVYNVDLILQTTTFMPGIRVLLNTVEEMGGFVETAIVEGRDMRFPAHERSASYTIRLHTDRLSEFLVVVENNFNLLMLRQFADDVTVRYEHIESTLDDLREQEQRARDELGDTALTSNERRNLERRLAGIQSSIRNNERNLNIFDDLVLYSTINIQLFEVIFPDEIIEEAAPFGLRVGNEANRTWDGFVNFLQGLLIGVIRHASTLITLAIVATIVIVVFRRVRKAKAEKAIPPQTAVVEQVQSTNDESAK